MFDSFIFPEIYGVSFKVIDVENRLLVLYGIIAPITAAINFFTLTLSDNFQDLHTVGI